MTSNNPLPTLELSLVDQVSKVNLLATPKAKNLGDCMCVPIKDKDKDIFIRAQFQSQSKSHCPLEMIPPPGTPLDQVIKSSAFPMALDCAAVNKRLPKKFFEWSNEDFFFTPHLAAGAGAEHQTNRVMEPRKLEDLVRDAPKFPDALVESPQEEEECQTAVAVVPPSLQMRNKRGGYHYHHKDDTLQLQLQLRRTAGTSRARARARLAAVPVPLPLPVPAPVLPQESVHPPPPLAMATDASSSITLPDIPSEREYYHSSHGSHSATSTRLEFGRHRHRRHRPRLAMRPCPRLSAAAAF